MALPPIYASHAIHLPSASGLPTQPHTLELYLDYTCPFSAKLFKNLIIDYVVEYLPTAPPAPTPLTIIFRHQVQPWHPSSTLTHEAALAVEAVARRKGSTRGKGGAFGEYSRILFENQTLFFDLNVRDETREQTYSVLAGFAEQVRTFDDEGKPIEIFAEEVEGLLRLKEGTGEGALNTGNEVTDALKWHVRLARAAGVHVSPTCLWDGIRREEISSGWGREEWRGFFERELKQ